MEATGGESNGTYGTGQVSPTRPTSLAECLADDLDGLTSHYPGMKRFERLAAELHTYIANNAGAIPNYAERWRLRERVATSFISKIHSQKLVVGKRSAKVEQMQWSPRARVSYCRPARGRSMGPCGRRCTRCAPAWLPMIRIAPIPAAAV